MLNNLKKNELTIWFGLILFGGLYSQSNLGEAGLYLPFNVVVWTLISLFIIYTIHRQTRLKIFVVNPFLSFLSFTLILIFSISLINQAALIEDVLLTAAAILGVAGFVYAMAQYQVTKIELKACLEILVFVAFLQAIIGLIQVFDRSLWVYLTVFEYAPLSISKGIPLGSFQQVNMFASFMAVAIVSIGVLVIHFSKHLNIRLSFVLLLSSFFCYMLFITGSRAGLLGLSVGVMVLFFIVYKVKKSSVYKPFILFILSIVFGFLLALMYTPAGNGLESVGYKMVRVSDGADARQMLFTVAILQFFDAPLFGQGFGNYLNSFLTLDKGIEASSPLFKYTIKGFVHPHNEFLYWLINSGVVVLMCLLFLIWKFVGAFRLSNDILMNLSILAIVIPLIIQANLTYMFTLSVVHLFLLICFIPFMVSSLNRERSFLIPNKLFILLLPFLIMLFGLFISACIHTLVSTKEVIEFNDRHLFNQAKTKEEAFNTVYLKYASDNPIYKDGARKSMLLMVDEALDKQNVYEVIQFIRWINQYEYLLGEKAFLKKLITSYLFIKREDLALKLFNEKRNVLDEIDQNRFNRVFSKVSNVSGE